VSTVYEYALESLSLEFELDGTPSRGHLTVWNEKVGEEQTFGARIDIASSKAVATYVKEAQALYPKAFPADDLTLRTAINELGIHVKDDERARKARASEEEDEETDSEAAVDEDVIENLIGKEGVLDRYVEAVAKARKVHGDRSEMKLVALGALSAQLEPPSADNPAGANVVLIGEPGRGKNYIADAVASGLPKAFVYSFESASEKSFYYQADANPERFRHTWVYPNEAEATDRLVETLRPLLSKGSASHKTVDTSGEDSNAFREFNIAGPITVTIPTTRNKLDTQLQTRMLVSELEDFKDRVPKHSAQVSETFLASYAEEDHDTVYRKWRAAFSDLIKVRRVVIPSMHPDFRMRSNEVSHGARLWRNFLSLMLTNAWLEQRNRERITLRDESEAIVATAEDYRVAYEVFRGACERSVESLSETHRKILNAVFGLQKEEKNFRGAGFSLRRVGEKAGISHEVVRRNRSYLSRSLGFLHDDDESGLKLVKDADPSWWAKKEFIVGFPLPESVYTWWGTPKGVDSVDSTEIEGENPLDKPKSLSTPPVDMSTPPVDSEKPIDKPNSDPKNEVSTLSTPSEASPHTIKKEEGDGFTFST
jgi:hypothetical protein